MASSCWSLCKTGWSLYCLRLGAFWILAGWSVQTDAKRIQEPTEKIWKPNKKHHSVHHQTLEAHRIEGSTGPLSDPLVSTWTVSDCVRLCPTVSDCVPCGAHLPKQSHTCLPLIQRQRPSGVGWWTPLWASLWATLWSPLNFR